MRQPSVFRLLLPAALAAGCTPVVPFHLGETSEVLGRKQVSVGAVAGAGGPAGDDGAYLGGGTRVRVGIGHRQEIGAEVNGLLTLNNGLQPLASAAKLSWKGAPIPWLALIVGLGVSHLASGPPAVGGDLAVVVSPTATEARQVNPYAGARFAFALPAGQKDVYASGGIVESLILPVGVAFGAAAARAYFEAGLIASWNQGQDYFPTHARKDYFYYGFYGLLGFSYAFGR